MDPEAYRTVHCKAEILHQELRIVREGVFEVENQRAD
jgi:hypothetical protein